MKIADEFGKKIGGSRRDLWKSRGLCLADLEGMNSMERSKYVKKDNVWPKPDYEEMRQEKDVKVVYFYKKVRDAFAAKPYEGEEESYIQILSEFRSYADEMRTTDDVLVFFDKHIEAYAAQNGYRWTLTPEFSRAGGSKVFKVIANVTLSDLAREIKKKQFLYTEDEKILSNYNIYPKSMFTLKEENCTETSIWLSASGYGFRVNRCTVEEFNQIPDNYCIILMHQHTFISAAENEEVAKKALLEATKTTLAKADEKTSSTKRKKKFVPVQFAALERIGTDVLHDRNITGEDYLNTFHFRGGEFGNYMTEKDRQCSLNYGYEAFHDLAVALDISDSEIGINEALSIAFGARGSGDANAHFEPAMSVINLTKMRGAGSLAHEYGHALDFMLSMQAGNRGAYTEQKRTAMPDSVKKLIEVMNWKETKLLEQPEEYKKKAKKAAEQACCFLKNEFQRSSEGMQEPTKVKRRVPTDYKAGSNHFDKAFSKHSNGYWSSNVEMFARAFSCYVKDKLEEKGMKNDYLCGHSDCYAIPDENGSIIRAYPYGEERAEINKAIDAVMDDFRTIMRRNEMAAAM